MAYSSQNMTFQAFKTFCLAVFFLQFPLAAAVNSINGGEFTFGAHDPYTLSGLVFVIGGQLFLLYALLTKNSAFGLLAAGYCGGLWLLGFIGLLLDAWLGFLSPTGVEIVFLSMQWWVVWFFFFHAAYL